MAYTHEEKDRLLTNILNSLVEKEAKDKKEVVRTLKELADDLDKHNRNGKIANISFGVSGVVATGLTVAGVATAPFTFGVSLGLTIGGLALGVSSGAGVIGNTIVGRLIKSKTLANAQKAKDRYFETTEQLIKLARVLNESGRNEVPFADLKSEKFGSSPLHTRDKAVMGVMSAGATGQGLRAAAVVSALVTREAIDTATKTVASVLKTGLMAAKIAGALISAFSLPLDIYTIVVNSKELHNKTPAEGALEIRMTVRNIEDLQMFKGNTVGRHFCTRHNIYLIIIICSLV